MTVSTAVRVMMATLALKGAVAGQRQVQGIKATVSLEPVVTPGTQVAAAEPGSGGRGLAVSAAATSGQGRE